MTDTSSGYVHAMSGGGLTATHPQVQSFPVLAAPTNEQDTNTLRAPFMPIACWRLEDLRFDFGSSFIKPEAAEEFAQLAELVKERPEAPLSIFGHADPIGLDENNKKLSGRRAAAVYAMLTRQTEIFEDIYSQIGKYTAPHEVDQWGTKVVQQILQNLGYSPGSIDGKMGDQTREAVKAFQNDQGLTVDGNPGRQTRAKLFLAYMDKNCRDGKGDPFKLEPSAFLAQGKDSLGKGDYQGCGEFNPLMLFSQEEQNKDQKPENKAERDEENGLNRRVLVLLFRPGNCIEPDRWPCPRAKEGVSGCKKRFWSDGEDRRSRRLPTDRRKYEETDDTFACRFYDRLANTSPCERRSTQVVFQYGLESGKGFPWSDKATLKIFSVDGTRTKTFAMSQGKEAGTHRVFIFAGPKKGLKYRAQITDGKVKFDLFDPVELFRIQDPGDPLNTLPLPQPPEPKELLPLPPGPPQTFNGPVDEMDGIVVDNAADSEGLRPKPA